MSFITDVQSGKPGHFGSEFFMAKRMAKIKWPKDGHTFTFNFEICFQEVFAIFLAFAFRYIRSGELFVQQPVLHNEGRLSCSVNKYIPRCTYPFYKVFDLTKHAYFIERHINHISIL